MRGTSGRLPGIDSFGEPSGAAELGIDEELEQHVASLQWRIVIRGSF